MNKEIKLRKRRFWTICFVIVFAMIQFFFNDAATAEIYSLSLPDAVPNSPRRPTFRR